LLLLRIAAAFSIAAGAVIEIVIWTSGMNVAIDDLVDGRYLGGED